MKTYSELMTENFLFANPLIRLSSLRGAYKAVENLARDIVYHGTKFLVKNPHLVLAGAIIVDFTLLDGATTKAIAKYFKETFPGHAMHVYDELAKISMDNKIQPGEVARAFIAVMDKVANEKV